MFGPWEKGMVLFGPMGFWLKREGWSRVEFGLQLWECRLRPMWVGMSSRCMRVRDKLVGNNVKLIVKEGV